MKIRKKNRAILALVAVVSLVAAVGFAGSKLNSDEETLAAGAYTKYEFQDWIYYDPVSGSTSCNGDKYWTVWDQNTTCYRFFMVDHNDTTSKSTVRLVLDHDVARETFANIDSVLANTKTTWKNYTGTMSLMSENDIVSTMELTTRPTLSNISVNAGGFVVYRYTANTMYYNNGVQVNNGGWWTSDLYPSDNSYAYTITEYGNNRLVDVTKKRGIRPMITLEKSKITGSSQSVTDITNLTKNASVYKYTYAGKYDGHNYKQLQGFTLTNENLVFYSSNAGNPNYGLVLGRTGNNFSTVVSGTPSYDATGHGNDMTFDSKRNRVLLVGPNSYSDIWIYNGTTLKYTGKKEGVDGSAIGYDDVNDRYILNVGRRAFITDANFNQLYSIDIPHDETGQGFEYHNGYLYQTSSAFSSCPNTYQKYCNGLDNNSSVINVYNVKFNQDGTPSKNFGRRVARLVVDGSANLAELESIAFHNDEVYLGFAAQSVDSTYVYKFYHFNYSKIANELVASVKYKDTASGITVTISSGDQLKAVNGYTLSDDGYSLTKTVNAASVSESVKVCDNYGNCKTINVSHNNSSYGIYTYTLSFNANGGIGSLAAVKCSTTAGSSSCIVTIPTTEPTRENYYFLGYATKASAATAKYQPGGTITMTANKTLYAVWADGDVEWQENQAYTKASGGDMVLRINYPVENFTALKIDGVEVDNANNDKYKVEEGSTIITVYGTHLDTLEPGDHTLQAVYDNGVTKDASFAVTDSSIPDSDDSDDQGGDGQDSGDGGDEQDDSGGQSGGEYDNVDDGNDGENKNRGNDDDNSDVDDASEDEDDVPVPNTSSGTPDTGANTKMEENNSFVMAYILPIVAIGIVATGFVRHRNKGHRKFEF